MEQEQAYSLTNDNFAWKFSFISAITVLIALPIIRPETYIPLYTFIKNGIPLTLFVTFSGILISSVVGLLVGVGRAWNRVLNKILSIYVEVVRGIPLLVQLFYIYFVLGRLLSLDRLSAAVVALAFCYGAYMAEIVRAGIISIPQGQIEAAKSLGMTKLQVYRYVIIPQAVKIILPPFGNEFIMMLKDSSLVSIIAVSDIMQKSREYASVHFNYFETFSVVALFYLILTLFFSKAIAILENGTLSRNNSTKTKKGKK